MEKLRVMIVWVMIVIGGICACADEPEQYTDEDLDSVTIEELLARGIPGETVPYEEEIPSTRGFYTAMLSLKKKTLDQEDSLEIERKVKKSIINYAKTKKDIEDSKKRLKEDFKKYIASIEENEQKFDGQVYFDTDRPPSCDINRHFAKHFRYPKEAWKKEKQRTAVIQGIVRKDGKMVGIQVQSTENPELVAELTRVAELMHWTPARNGRYWLHEPISEPLNCYRRFYVDLTPRNSGRNNFYYDMSPVAGESTIPYGLEDVVKNGRKGMKAVRKSNLRLDSPEITGNFASLKEYAEMFPEYVDVSVPYLRLLGSMGDKRNAIATLDTCQWNFNPFRYINDNWEARPQTREYNGKSELMLSLTRLILYSHYGMETDLAFADADELIGRRVIDRDLYGQLDVEANRKRMQQLQRDLVTEYYQGQKNIGENTPIYEKVTRELSVDELSRGIGYWADKGQIDNAAVMQLTELITNEFNMMRQGKGVTGGDMMKLFGIRALAVWLHKGEEGLRSYIADMQQGDASRQVKSYLGKLQKRYDENAPAMADREGVIEALACLVPPQGADEAACKAFYERRRAAEKVFPIKWLANN